MRNAAELRREAIGTGYYNTFLGDGASVPWENFLAFNLPSGLTLRAYKQYLDSRWPEAFRLHDFLYTPYGKLLNATREEADSALREDIARDSIADSQLVYAAVRIGGAPWWGNARAGFTGFSPPVTVGTVRRTSMAASSLLARISLEQTLDGRSYFNVLHYRQRLGDASAFDAAALATLAKNVFEAFSVGLGAFQVIALEYIKAYGVALNASIGMPVTGPPYTRYGCPPAFFGDHTPVSSVAGGVDSDYLPTCTAGVIRKISGRPGRENQGSLHLAGVPEESTVGDFWDGTIYAALQTAASDLVPNVFTFTVAGIDYAFEPVIFQPTYINRVGAPGIYPVAAAAPIISAPVTRRLGTMRHRKTRLSVPLPD